jgi:isochorismate synthase
MLIHQLLTKNIAFAAYRLPGEKLPVFVAQPGPVREFSLAQLEQQKGFVIAPFDAYKSGKAFLIEPAFVSQNRSEMEKLFALPNSFPDKGFQLPKDKNFVADRETYLQQVSELVARIKNGEAQKVVLSRVLEKPLSPDFDFDLFFDTFQQNYPDAFVYLFHLPGEGVWAGATPETLFNRNGGFYETMALAGTQKRPSDDKPLNWEEKEKEEQALVTGFVEEQIGKLRIENYEESRPETIFAGSLAHICTRFRLPANTLHGKTGRFVKALHPTPAVCGLPKEKAWQLISETEKHQRHFYTGFLGPWQMENRSHLFVNLRCARFLNEKLALYVGGGLTAASKPEKEWQETEDKSATILSVVEKLHNFAP